MLMYFHRLTIIFRILKLAKIIDDKTMDRTTLIIETKVKVKPNLNCSSILAKIKRKRMNCNKKVIPKLHNLGISGEGTRYC